jgi:dehydrogenase/reductase SDR family member 12
MYRLAVWYMKGKSEYTKHGYAKRLPAFNPKDLEVDAKGRSFVVTGANSGVGKAACIDIAMRGGTIHMVCRNKERGEEAKSEIIAKAKNENVFLHILDMADRNAIKAFVEDFIAKKLPINVLINNAGLMENKKKEIDGMEYNFAVNSYGVYLMTSLFIPYLRTFPSPRVITVSSGGMLLEKLEADDPMLVNRTFVGREVYSQQKRQQVVMTEEWAKANPDISFYSMHPGWADTPAVRESLPDFFEKMKDDLRTAEQVADTISWLALCNNIPADYNGGFIQDREPVSKHLPLAWTKSSPEEVQRFMAWMENPKLISKI